MEPENVTCFQNGSPLPNFLGAILVFGRVNIPKGQSFQIINSSSVDFTVGLRKGKVSSIFFIQSVDFFRIPFRLMKIGPTWRREALI